MNSSADANLPLPLVSAIVPAYNSERFLAKAIESALSQTYGHFEIVVVNDGSSDRTGAIAAEYAHRHPDKLLVVEQQNGGLVQARNTAIRHAKGKYLALLDSDDIWLPHHLASCAQFLEAHPSCGLVHANIQFIDEKDRELSVPARNWPAGCTDAWKRVFERQEHVSCPTAVFRKSVIDEIGPFDPRFNRLGCEDRDLWLRILAVCESHYFPDVHAQYRQHGNNMSSARENMEAAALLLVNKHGTGPRGRGLARRARAAVYLESAETSRMRHGLKRNAWSLYAKSLLHWPLDRASWAGLAKLALGRSD